MMFAKEVRDAWVAALRSGHYVQGGGCLSYHDNGPRYCCLGVLADVCALWHSDIAGGVYPGCSSIPHIMMRGLTEDHQESLIQFNDVKGWTFAQIADYIEANIPYQEELL